MANVQHSLLTDPNIHEPKGISAATSGQLYKADGAGSGEWIKVQGFGQYQDTDRTVGSPAQTISTTVSTQFTCDGGFLTKEQLPSDASASLWNVSTNKHIPISIDDTYTLRISFTAESYAGSSPYITIDLDIGGASGIILSETVPLQKAGAAQDIVIAWPVFTDSTYNANGGTVYLTYTGTGTCKIYKNSVFVERHSKAP